MADEYAVGVTAGTMGAGVTATTNIIQNVNPNCPHLSKPNPNYLFEVLLFL
jgi:hypothetical protein